MMTEVLNFDPLIKTQKVFDNIGAFDPLVIHDPLVFDSTNIDIVSYARCGQIEWLDVDIEDDIDQREKRDRPLIILDLDETLVKSVPEPLDRDHCLYIYKLYVYPRPFLEYFLNSLYIKYDIAIWSAGGSGYVNQIVDCLVPKNIKLKFVWSNRHCVYQEIKGVIYVTKPLSLLSDKEYPNIKNKDNMLILDDNGDLTHENDRKCLIPAKYEGSTHDYELINILYYLDYISDEPDFTILPHRSWRRIVQSVLDNEETDLD